MNMAAWQRACVYTCLLGNYETLNEQPVSAQSSIPFICLTDDAGLQSSTWRIVKIDSFFPLDPVRSQRQIKLLPHRFLPDFELSLYIDNSVILTRRPEEIFDRYLAASEFALPLHSYRDRVLDEFIEVARLAMDDPERISEQLDHYRSSDPGALDERPYWSAIQLRRHGSPDVQRALESWVAHVLRYSRRDQLSANAAFRLAKFKPHALEIDNNESWFHTWPHAAERVRRSVRSASGLLQEKINTLGDELAQANLQIQRRAATIGALEEELAQARVQIRRQAAAIDAMESSLSWRLTAPLRSVRRQLFRPSE
jgi:hypothetical protein